MCERKRERERERDKQRQMERQRQRKADRLERREIFSQVLKNIASLQEAESIA